MNEVARKLTQVQREAIILRDGGMCYYCGESAMVVDHIIPWSWSHNDDEENLVASCVICNLIAGDRVFDSLEHKRKYIEGRRDKRKWRHRIEALRLAGYCIGCGEKFTEENPQETILLCKFCYSGVKAVQETPPDVPVRPWEYVRPAYISGDCKTDVLETNSTLESQPDGLHIPEEEKKIIDDLNKLALSNSWRKISEIEPYKSAGINFATLRRYATGDRIQNQDHRKALGLQYEETVKSCPDCGEIHEQYATCNINRGQRKRSLRPPATEIRKDDAAIAAAQIGRNCHFKVTDLIVELSKLQASKG